jgi:hypothetical protein
VLGKQTSAAAPKLTEARMDDRKTYNEGGGRDDDVVRAMRLQRYLGNKNSLKIFDELLIKLEGNYAQAIESGDEIEASKYAKRIEFTRGIRLRAEDLMHRNDPKRKK